MKIHMIQPERLKFTDPRMELAFRIAYATSLRSKEFRTLRIEQLLNPQGEVREIVTVRVKGSRHERIRYREVYFPSTIREQIQIYIRDHRGGATSGYLFPGSKSAIMAKSTMHKLWKDAQAGADQKRRVHDIRHSSITRYYEKTHDIEKARQFAGHSSILTTQHYTHIRAEDVHKEQERIFA